MLRMPTRMRHRCLAVVTVVCASCASDGESPDPATDVLPSSTLDMDVQRGVIDVGTRRASDGGLFDGKVSDLSRCRLWTRHPELLTPHPELPI